MRDFKTAFEYDQLIKIQKGIFENFKYRDLKCLKSPFDLIILTKLIWDLKPKTIIEIGSKDGGSAMFLNDISSIYGLNSKIISIDIEPPRIEIENVSFLQGDASNLKPVFCDFEILNEAKPWLVIEDSAHTYDICCRVLQFFADKLSKDDYLIIEDGVLSDLGLGDKYQGGPNLAIADFFQKHPLIYEIDLKYCDMFGQNFTYNPNGYLRKI